MVRNKGTCLFFPRLLVFRKPSSVHDLNLRRLKADEQFLGSLRSTFTSDAVHVNRLQQVAAGGEVRSKDAAANRGTFGEKLIVNPPSGSDTLGYGIGARKALDKSVVRIADEVLDYIGGRKEFWTIQGDRSSNTQGDGKKRRSSSSSNKNRPATVGKDTPQRKNKNVVVATGNRYILQLSDIMLWPFFCTLP